MLHATDDFDLCKQKKMGSVLSMLGVRGGFDRPRRYADHIYGHLTSGFPKDFNNFIALAGDRDIDPALLPAPQTSIGTFF
ncbi:uncharacterized protein H6S33_005987 [Morchella sextelata]|jgi:hypothetical protein|uniref:uncharacterized protein n=1 Tax=Morchella sextelata TaxID=1174677 RepID=UPI001D047AAF|nr:uncharacterized protein H6S33_005987 [Morchella sextelata]KAH0614101.1 hypothetical protein H6S33_005987 [Morchella sextelata]